MLLYRFLVLKRVFSPLFLLLSGLLGMPHSSSHCWVCCSRQLLLLSSLLSWHSSAFRLKEGFPSISELLLRVTRLKRSKRELLGVL